MTISTESNEAESVPTDERLPENVDTSRDGLVVTVTSPTGGSGKSSTALLLGTTLAQASKKAHEAGLAERPLDVVIVDLDIFDSHIGFLLDQRTPTVINILISDTPHDPETIKSNLHYSAGMGIHTLLGPVSITAAQFLSPVFYRDTIRTLKTMFDVVILDTSVNHYDDLIKTVALPEADAILLVTTLSNGSIDKIGRWIDVAKAPLSEWGYGVDLNKVGVVVNQAIQGVGVGVGANLISAAQGVPLLVAIPLDTAAVQAAGNATRLEDIVLHPTIGPAYFKLANKIVRGTALLPLIDDKNIQ